MEKTLFRVFTLFLLFSSPAAQATSLIGDGVLCHDVNLRACGVNDSTAIVGAGVEFNEGGIVQVDVDSNTVTFANGKGSQQTNGSTFITTIDDLDFDIPGAIVGFNFTVSGVTKSGSGNLLTETDVDFTADSVTLDWSRTFWPAGSFVSIELITDPPSAATAEQCISEFEAQFVDYAARLEGDRDETASLCSKTRGKDGETIVSLLSENAENSGLKITFTGVAKHGQCGITQRGQFVSAEPLPGFGGALAGGDVKRREKYLADTGCDLSLTDPSQKIVFATSQRFTGDLIAEAKGLGLKGRMRTGLEAADKICNKLAEDAELTGSYTAWLSDSNSNAIDRVTQANVPYVRANGDHVADNFADILDCSDSCLDFPVQLDENGSPVGDNSGGVDQAADVWTATSKSGVATGTNCQDWSSDSSAETGTVGNALELGAWTSYSARNCATDRRLLCFEN